MKSFLRAVGLLVCVTLLPTELFCVASSLETQGEVLQALLRLLLWGNVLWIALLWWFPRAALIGLLSVGLLIVPYQVMLLDRLTRLNSEVMRLVDSRLRLRAEGKAIPTTLDDYAFSDPEVKRFIYSYAADAGGKDFTISYFVVQPGITHTYSSTTGWFYYPD